MKKNRLIISFLFITSFIIISCNNLMKKNDFQENDYDVEIKDFIKDYNIAFESPMICEYMGLSTDGYTKLILSELVNHGRYVSYTDSLIGAEELVDLLDQEINNFDIPDFYSLEQDDIEKIMNHLSIFSEQIIIDNIDVIMDIYQAEVSLSSLDNIISNLTVYENNSRAAGDYYVEFGDDIITLAELGACLKHPFSALGLLKQKEKAYLVTEEYMLFPKKTDEKSDAFRHSIWNIVMAKEGFGNVKEKLSWAEDFATAHEAGVKYNNLPSEMDLHNNNVGRLFYKQNSCNKNKKIMGINFFCGVDDPTYEEACSYIKAKALNAILIDESLDFELRKKLIQDTDKNELVYIREDDKEYE